MNQQFVRLLLTLLFVVSQVSTTILPPRLSTPKKTLQVKEGQTEVVLECNLDLGDNPIGYRWLKHYKLVTAALGFGYRSHHKVHLALHPITLAHEGIYECEAANDAGVDAVSIELIVERGGYTTQFKTEKLPDTSEVLSDLAASMNDVLAEGNCECDVMFLLHASPDAPSETLPLQANFVHTIGGSIISDNIRVSVATYSANLDMKLAFGGGTNRCALEIGLRDIDHKKWSTRLRTVLKEAQKKFKKSSKHCKVLFLPIFGSAGSEGAQSVTAGQLKEMGIDIFIMEVTDSPLPGVSDMASRRGDGQPYHWWIPKKIWPTIVSFMSYMSEELTGCDEDKHKSIPGVCVTEGKSCDKSDQCAGIGFGCLQGTCQSLDCRDNPKLPGCCTENDDFWCGDVTLSCKNSTHLCDGKFQCMNGADEDRCWQYAAKCAAEEVRCQSSTLCMSIYDLCDGEPHCPGAEDEDPKFCNSFPCPDDRTFRCRSGKCISKDRLCDGVFRDCSEGEDESLEYCSEKHLCPTSHPFKCDYGICIADRMVCDGAYNCLDALDESFCHDKKCMAERPFKCGDGTCVDLSNICNGVVDACKDGQDENDCENFTCPMERNLKCANGRCIDEWLRCDGQNDCGDNTDEEECIKSTTWTTSLPTPIITTPLPKVRITTPFPKPTRASCKPDEFYCTSGACIPNSKVCDGRRSCIDGEDEEKELCVNYPCPKMRSHRCSDGSCVKVKICDGVPDCADGADELGCSTAEPSTEAEKDIEPSPEPEGDDNEKTQVEDVKIAATIKKEDSNSASPRLLLLNQWPSCLFVSLFSLLIARFR